MQSKTVYRQWCGRHPELPLFLCPEWMDAVCGDAWDVLLFDDGRGRAAYVYVLSHKYRLSLLLNPQLTPYQGFWLFSGNEAFASECRRQIADWWRSQSISVLEQRFYPGVPADEWRQSGFRVRLRRTYRLSDIRQPETVWQGIAPATRRQIKKAQRAGLQLDRRCGAAEFYALLAADHGRPWYSQAYLDRLVGALPQNGILWKACDAHAHALAAVWVVFDAHTAYCLAYALTAEGRSCGALQWLLWQALQALPSEYGTRTFDFEGSMDPQVAYAYRHYGAEACDYVQVENTSLPGAIALHLKRLKEKLR